jgi:hypothetical protein
MENNEILLELPPNNKKIPFKKYSFKNWDFISHIGHMMSANEINEVLLQNNLLKIKHFPEIFNGYNRLFVINKENNFVYEFSPFQMLNLTNYEIRKENYDNKIIYYNPSEVKTKIPNSENKNDWTFSSCYMGNICNINNSEIKCLYEDKNLTEKKFKCEIDNNIQIQNLGNETKIKQYIECELYEDEFGDNGICETRVRLYIMEDSFSILLRCYLRVDNIIVRNINTNIFYKFGNDFIIRNFSVKEIPYLTLKNLGFVFRHDWNVYPYQSDQVDQFIKEKIFNITDKIILK